MNDTEMSGSAAPEGRQSTLPTLLPARMLNEVVYCPRLFYYEWVEGVFRESVDTVEGSLRHEKLAAREDALAAPSVDAPIKARSVQLSSARLGLIARIDLVEGEAGRVSPVEYKKGRPADGETGPLAWPADRVQVGVQALVLRDSGYTCDEAVLYYDETRQRVRVIVDDALVAETLAARDLAIQIAAGGVIPPPLVDSPKCPRCSLVSICLPDETGFCEQLQEPELDHQLLLFDDSHHATLRGVPPSRDTDGVLRRLVPARDDLRPLYVAGYGITVGKTGEVLRIKKKGAKVQDVRLGEISQVNLFGSVQLTAQALQAICRAEKPIAHFSTGGWFYGMTQGLGLRNVFLRREQFAKSDNEFFCSLVARRMVVSKIRNQRTMLRRNHVEPSGRSLEQLDALAERAALCTDREQLLGIEGAAAKLYFEGFNGMLKADGDIELTFEHRNRRPPRDPINAMLSFAYSLLAKDLTIVCHSVGFDPFVGFFHQPRFGRPALALDLMEGFRPLIADSTVLTAVNRRMVQSKHFLRVGPAIALTPAGRKAFLRAYEQRMDALVTHPLFGYRICYRAVLEVQTRLLARVVQGEIATYPGFETR